jgi:hypothetical protein
MMSVNDRRAELAERARIAAYLAEAPKRMGSKGLSALCGVERQSPWPYRFGGGVKPPKVRSSRPAKAIVVRSSR